jgi:hypothetical protein
VGTWALKTGEPYSPLGAAGTIAQTESRITVTASARPERAVTYQLDRPEFTYTTTTVRGDTWTHVAQARWVTNALLVTTKTGAGVTGAWEDMVIYSLSGPNTLTVVTVMTPKSSELGMSTQLSTYERSGPSW